MTGSGADQTATPAVVHVASDDVARRPGGLGRYAQNLSAATAGSVVVVVGRRHDTGTVIGVSDPDDALFTRIVAVARATLGRPHDIVDIHFALYGLVPALLGRHRALIAHHHGPWAEEARAAGDSSRLGGAIRNAAEAMVLRRAGDVVVLSHRFRDDVIARHGLFPARVHVIGPGVDCADSDRPGARRRLDLADEDHLVVTVRRLVPRTGVDTLIRAWVEVLELTVGLPGRRRLVVVGDGPERPALARLADQLGVADTVAFTGPISDGELADHWAAADVAVVPSTSLEGYGLVVLEAACHGTPSVVTDVGGLPEAIEPFGADLVVAPADPRGLASRLARGMTGETPFPRRADVRRIVDERSWAGVADLHRELYAGRLAPRPEPRVVFVLHTARPSGAELAVARLLADAEGFDAHVITFEDGPIVDQLRTAGVSAEVVPVPAEVLEISRAELSPARSCLTAARGLGGLGRMVRRLRQLRPDVVVATSLKSGLLCGLVEPLLPGAFVWSLTDLLDDPGYPRPAVRLARHFARNADATIANSAATLDSWRLSPSRRHVVVHPGHSRREPATPEPEGPATIAMVGRLAPWKGQHVFLDALAEAIAREPNAELRGVIAGAAMFGEETYAQTLRRRASRPDLAGRVTFLGHVPEPQRVLDAALIVVHASTAPEPFGQVIVEAMAAGRAVIASEAGGATEIVAHDINGLLVAPGDVHGLADAIDQLLCDVPRRRRLAGAAQDTAARFSIAATVEATRSVLTGVAGGP